MRTWATTARWRRAVTLSERCGVQSTLTAIARAGPWTARLPWFAEGSGGRLSIKARDEDDLLIDAVRAGDESAFVELVEGYRRELRVHCYRMLGSFDDAEDLVQETFLRAWRGRQGFKGRSTFRAWLYRIATNACLDFLDRHRRRPVAREPQWADSGAASPPAEIGWLQPFPDRMMEPPAPTEAEPDFAVVAKETISLAFLAAIQHLPPRQRATLILRDVLGWSTLETADMLEMSVTALKSALQRARATLRTRLPQRRADWAPTSPPTEQERELLGRFMEAHERADPLLLAELLSEEVRMSMPPLPFYFFGSAAVVAFAQEAFAPGSPLHHAQWRGILTRANRQPAVAAYVRVPGDAEFHPQVLNVLSIEAGRIVEITAFQPHLFPAFDLPPTLM